MSFTIAIIGRPNVGKSTLFNRLVGQKLALVDDEPGVTRDRREGDGRLGDLEFTVIDTAGLDEGAKGSLTARMQEQTETAIALADALMFVIDARAGLTPNDRAFADFARRANKPVVLVANKSEGRHGEVGAMESYALGLGDPVQISAEHGEGLSDLYDALRVLMPEPAEEGEEFDDDDIIESDEDFAQAPDPRRHRRPSQCRQIDADQSSARRGAAVDQRRGRHHARFHFGRGRPGRAAISACSIPPACGGGRGSRRSWKSCRWRMRCARCGSPKSS